MATAYAAFTSLVHLLEDLREHPRPPIQLDQERVDPLHSKISFFQRFLEDHHNTISRKFETEIAEAARAAEDLIEAHIADRGLYIYGSLRSVIDDMDLMEKEAMKMKQNEPSQGNYQRPTPPASSQPPSAATSCENNVVGIEDMVMKVMDKLTLPQNSGHKIISISGMGGIGKTTLARKVYDKPYIKDYFDVCVWATISKDYNPHESLVEILDCLGGKSKESLSKMSEDKLGEKLHKSLFGRRYLVVLDDMWDIEAWNRLRRYIEASSGSAILITTREAAIASNSSHDFPMDLLDEPKSWNLFCKNVFGKDSCPVELEYVGMEIANKCRGLPLSINVIGGHLAKSPRKKEYWMHVADNLCSVGNSENNEYCLKILSLSYTNLPVHIKPCFLYLGIFPEDKEILVSEIIRLWRVEGILKPINGKSLEDAANEYLNDLKARNLILASESSKTGKMKSFKIHDLLRDLCLRKGRDANFFGIVQKQGLRIRVAKYDRNFPCNFCERTRIRTLMLSGNSRSENYRFLRELPLCGGSLAISENQTIQYLDLVNLQCLEDKAHNEYKDHTYVSYTIPQSFYLLWNLQSLVIENPIHVEAPLEIWKMHQIRHIKIQSFHITDPPSGSNDILKHLQSAETILNLSFSEDLVKRIPNIMKLKVKYRVNLWVDEELYALNNVVRLEKLESFACKRYTCLTLKNALPNLTFPDSIKKLSFNYLQWDNVVMSKISLLPLLEVLKLSNGCGREWNIVEGQFVRLKYLELNLCTDLERFAADNHHFPCLEKLCLKFMYSLEEISSDIGDIPTLRSIELLWCPDPVVGCAKEIADAQSESGNEDLQIKVCLESGSSFCDAGESLTTSNFHASFEWIR